MWTTTWRAHDCDLCDPSSCDFFFEVQLSTQSSPGKSSPNSEDAFLEDWARLEKAADSLYTLTFLKCSNLLEKQLSLTIGKDLLLCIPSPWGYESVILRDSTTASLWSSTTVALTTMLLTSSPPDPLWLGPQGLIGSWASLYWAWWENSAPVTRCGFGRISLTWVPSSAGFSEVLTSSKMISTRLATKVRNCLSISLQLQFQFQHLARDVGSHGGCGELHAWYSYGLEWSHSSLPHYKRTVNLVVVVLL